MKERWRRRAGAGEVEKERLKRRGGEKQGERGEVEV